MIALMGGNEFRQACIPMDRELLSRVSHRPARVAIIPTAAARENPRRAADNGVRYFEALGAEASAVMIVARPDADDPALVASLLDADLVYLTGGDPGYLLDALQETEAARALRELHKAGRWVVGSSAGAMVLGAALAGGAGGSRPGLAMVGHVLVLPHHEEAWAVGMRRRLGDLPPGVIAVGIDTATACVQADGDEWEVLGAGAVTVYAPGGAERHETSGRFTLPGDRPS